MNKNIKLICLFGIVALASQSAMAAGLKVRGGVTSNTYSLDITPSTGSSYNYAKSNYSGTNLGLTWLMGESTYLDAALANGSGTWDGTYTNGTAFTSNMTRADSAFILGTNLGGASGNVVNLYAGWKNGETKLERAPGAASNPALNFKTSGLIFGGGLGFPVGGAGSLGLSLGMGVMSGSYDSTASGVTTTYKADMALGFSYGIGYSYPFTKNLGMAIDYKGNAYKYIFDSGLTTQWDLNETFNTASGSLYFTF